MKHIAWPLSILSLAVAACATTSATAPGARANLAATAGNQCEADGNVAFPRDQAGREIDMLCAQARCERADLCAHRHEVRFEPRSEDLGKARQR